MATHTRHALHQLRTAVNRQPDRFVTNVYTRMFAIDPDLRDLFGVSMAAQRVAFHRVIDHVLEAIPAESGHAELVEFLAQLGRDHRKFGVEPEHYHVMYAALMGEFGSLMAGYWDAETEQTVSQAMMLVTGVMRGAAESATHPARWTAEVVEKYRITRDLAVVRLLAHSPLTFNTGQYLEVHTPQWPKQWRNLSPAIPPNPAGELEFHVRAIPRGTVSTAIVSETSIGDVWTLAQGHGTLHVDRDSKVLMVAGGTGLAPLRALLIEMSMRADSPETNPWLRVTAVSQEESDPWWINAVATPAELGIDHEIGTLADVVARSGDWQDRQVLIAGSPQMIENTRRTLVIAGVRASRIQHDPVF
jgi:NAD(P)H-flavin reductase/hemoglobin-like flavoprotein